MEINCNAAKFKRLSDVLETCTAPFLIVKEKTMIFRKNIPDFK